MQSYGVWKGFVVSDSPRVFFAGLFHETHTFLEGLTTWDDFEVVAGVDLLKRTGDSSPLGGALAVARECHWNVVPGVVAVAAPSATVSDKVFVRFWEILEPLLTAAEQEAPLDALYLVLHGAMVCQTIADVEGELLQRMRQQLDGRKIPVFGVYDLHANFTPRMAKYAHCLSAYRCNPHTDGREAAVRSARLLQKSLKGGVVPRTLLAQPQLIWPPTGTGTDTDPMKSLEQQARELQEKNPDFWEVNVNAGFAFADIYDAGVSFTVVTTGEVDRAKVALEELCQSACRMAEQGNVVDPPVDEALSKLDRNRTGLTVLVEPADNIGGGSPGDCTGLMRAMLEHRLPNCAVCICDAPAVKLLQRHRSGDFLTLAIGGRGSRLDPGPLTLEVELLKLCDGRFELCDKQSHLATMVGDFFDMGDCAIVRHGEMTILLTSVKTPPMDLGQWKHVGIDPAQFSFVGVKAAVSHRRAWDPISLGNIWVATPGPCSSSLLEFPFEEVRRPIFPLDSISFEDLSRGLIISTETV